MANAIVFYIVMSLVLVVVCGLVITVITFVPHYQTMACLGDYSACL